MDIQWPIVIASAIVGFTVGLTGMGGGALMTPILLIFFGVTPTAAVSSDLVAAMVMKPVGGGVHIRRKTVRWDLVKWLCVGSIPAAFAGVFLLQEVGDSEAIEELTATLLGITLLLASTAMILKSYIQGRRSAKARAEGRSMDLDLEPRRTRVLPTIAVGIFGGFLVGLTSVGSGSIVIVSLMLLYPALRGAELVGTDLVQAVPLVTAAAIAHIIVGDFQLGLTATILLGALPAVWLGARMSSRAPDGLIRPALIFVLVASGLKLLGLPSSTVGILLVGFALLALPIWGAIDAAAHPQAEWSGTGYDRGRWIRWQALLAPIGIGFGVAVAYFARVRPAVVTARELEPQQVGV